MKSPNFLKVRAAFTDFGRGNEEIAARSVYELPPVLPPSTTPIDVVNGEGTRCTLFVSGCEHFCQECHNATTWAASKGTPFDQTMEDRIIKDLGDSRIKRDGLSLSGGDPLYLGNLPGMLKLVKRVKAEYSKKISGSGPGTLWKHSTVLN